MSRFYRYDENCAEHNLICLSPWNKITNLKLQYVCEASRMRSKKKSVISSLSTTTVYIYTICSILISSLERGVAIAPTIDYSHNMRILKLPQSTPIGNLIYRLKGSDGDANSQLMFGLSGHEARTLLDVVPVQRSWNEADVYLRSKPEKSHYNFTLFVTDGNKTTQVESTILVTDDEQILKQNSSSQSSLLLPFLNTKHVFHVPENAKPNELIGSISVLESEKSDLPVRFELRGKGSERFSINYVFGPKGQSKGELVLAQEVDYEKQNLFSLKVLALNGWTDIRFDTRNVASMDIVITVGDVQDSPPVFKNLPQSIRLPTDLRAGQVVYKCEAEDGDFADQRPVQYALDAGSPVAGYFDIDKSSGEIKLTKSINELLMNAAWQQQQSSQSMLTIFASEVPDPSSYDHLWPPMYARVEIPLLLVDAQNEPPQFLGGWQTRERGQQMVSTLHGYLPEWTGSNDQQQLVVRWFVNGSSSESALLDGISKSLGNRPSVLDLGLGSNGTFELTLEGADAELFYLEPSGFPISRQTTFSLSVAEHANKSLFDHEHNNKLSHLFTVDVVARDFGSPERLSSRIRCLIELTNINDNWPTFETDLYSFSVYENAPIGYVLGQVRARDSDSMGKVSYVSMTGVDSHIFKLNQDTGQVTLEAHLDREKKNFYLFLIEARDSTSDHGLTNHTQLIINVLDVNDNAPVFLQTHYDAFLLSDGTFYQPLQVRAVDADEPGTANSQVAYEIIAGNLNEQFSIDSVSGVIYPAAGGGKQAQYPPLPLGHPTELPSTLKEPILPVHTNTGNNLDQAGKIRPMHEVEESPRASRRLQVISGQALSRQQQPHSTQHEMPALDVDQLPALDLLMSLESSSAVSLEPRPDISATVAGPARASAGSQLGPITMLVIRAHDFGIPLRSSTVKVNIFNQALLTRSVSLILNGTIEQLDTKREAIERAFSSLTGSRTTIESLDPLSPSLSVARARLAVPEHSLVDLTDLSSLMNAIEYRTHSRDNPQPTFYYDSNSPPSSSNLSAPTGSGIGGSTHLGHNIFSDIHSYAIDSNAALERRLLIYIIIVGVCILALLVAWMIYYCCSRSDRRSQKKLISGDHHPTIACYRPSPDGSSNKTHAKVAANSVQTTHHGVGSPIANNLAKGQSRAWTTSQSQAIDGHSMSNLLTPIGPDAIKPIKTTTTSLKPNNYSLYNGQVWFEPNHSPTGHNSSSLRHPNQNHSITSGPINDTPFGLQRRASSAPSGGGLSLDSALHSALARGNKSTWTTGGQVRARNGAGQFFPNTLGYTRNVASIAADQPDAYSRLSGQRRNRRVAPILDGRQAELQTGRPSYSKGRRIGGHLNGAFVGDHNDESDLEAARSLGHRDGQQCRKQSSLSSTGSTVSVTDRNGDNCSTEEEISIGQPTSSSVPAAEMSVELDSDQELLGFDSSGTPIIATHTRTTSIKPIVVDRDRIGSVVSRPSKSRESLLQRVDQVTEKQTDRDDKDTKLHRTADGTVAQPDNQPVETSQKESESQHEDDANGDRGGGGDEDGDKDGDRDGNGDGDGDKEEGGETSVEQPKERNNRSTNEDAKAQMLSSRPTTNPLMDELTERISSRKGSANNNVHEQETTGAASASGGQAANSLTTGETVTRLDSSTSASERRQLMLRQEGTKKRKTTMSISNGGESLVESLPDDGSNADTASISSRARELASMKNGELLERKSIFALTYSGLATDKLPLAD